MEQVAASSAKRFFSKMGDDLKSFRLLLWGQYLSMICSILVFFSALSFKSGFWMSLLMIVFGLVMFCLDFFKCFICIKGNKDYDAKLDPIRQPLIKGPVYIVVGIIIFKASIIPSILVIVCGLFYVVGNFVDKKKDNAKAPMV